MKFRKAITGVAISATIIGASLLGTAAPAFAAGGSSSYSTAAACSAARADLRAQGATILISCAYDSVILKYVLHWRW